MAIFHSTPIEENGDVVTANHPQSSQAQLPQDSSDEEMNNKVIRGIVTLRNISGEIVNHPKVQLIIILLIVLNAIMMGIATFDFVSDDPDINTAFETTDLVFLIIFSVEAGMQLCYHGAALFFDGWLVFDVIIVVLSWSLTGLQIIRAFRVFRALRIITRITTMRNLVAALFDIMPRLAAITALLCLIFYIFAVLFTQLFGELELSDNYFNRLDNSLFTLFVMMTMEWADVAREVMEQVPWAWLPFVTFIMITGFIVFNLIIAVVCDAVAVIESKDDSVPNLFGYDESVGAMSEGTTSEEERAEALSHRLNSLLDSQRQMQSTLEMLSKELYESTLQSLKEEEVKEKKEEDPVDASS